MHVQTCDLLLSLRGPKIYAILVEIFKVVSLSSLFLSKYLFYLLKLKECNSLPLL